MRKTVKRLPHQVLNSRLFSFARRLKPAEKIFISGTGRAGTTLLMQILTLMGEDTGYDASAIADSHYYFPAANAGLERNVLDPGNPGIVKSPYLCDLVEDVIAAGIKIKHVIIPLRRFSDAAASREKVQRESGRPDATAGGLWGMEPGLTQEDVLRKKFTSLVESLVRHDIPMTFIEFPRFATDPEYLFEKLRYSALPHIKRRNFNRAFKRVCKRELIHNFPGANVDEIK